MPSRTLSVEELGVLADDLTGACDVGACFVPSAGAAVVALTPEAAGHDLSGLAVINCQSRSLPPETSRTTAREAGRRLAARPVIFKKIDTAFRGPVGAELEGLLEAVGERKVVVAPAVPSVGRTTRGGMQFIGGVPIHETEFAQDPSWPIFSSNILENIRRTGAVACEVCDAETEQDLLRVVDRALQASPVVLVGSVGLGDALAGRLRPGRAPQRAPSVARRPAVVCGSSYLMSHLQLESAAARWNTRVIDLWPARPEADDRELREQQPPLLLRIPSEHTCAGYLSPTQLLQAFCARAARILDAWGPDGLGLVGGDTAYRLLGDLGAVRLLVEGRLAEGVSHGSIQGGALDGLPLVLKGGSIGQDDMVARMLERLTRGERSGTT